MVLIFSCIAIVKIVRTVAGVESLDGNIALTPPFVPRPKPHDGSYINHNFHSNRFSKSLVLKLITYQQNLPLLTGGFIQLKMAVVCY